MFCKLGLLIGFLDGRVLGSESAVIQVVVVVVLAARESIFKATCKGMNQKVCFSKSPVKPKKESKASAKSKNLNPDDTILSLNVLVVDTVCGHCQLGTGIPKNGLVLKNTKVPLLVQSRKPK